MSPKLVEDLFAMVRRLNEDGMTILLVEQNVRQTLQIASLGFVIEKGRVVLSGTGQELIADPFVRKAFLGL
ncbi:High-affinity branched-chain amino acid transport ATP-binding protein LivF [compost metagenome]